jgi:hypothetical protein
VVIEIAWTTSEVFWLEIETSEIPWAEYQASVSSSALTAWSASNEKPDPCAAAICIRVRPAGILSEKDAACLSCERRNGPQALSESCEVSSNGYFFFFLAVFFAFFAFFAFLAMLPSIVPRS